MSIVKPYQGDNDNKKSQISRMFNNVAPYYDFLNRFLSMRMDVRWRKKAIRMLETDQPKMVLDVATGTGDVALETMRILAPDKIVGIDISTEMLAIGRQKVAKKGWSEQIDLQEGDSENLPFQDNTFDAVTVAFGVRNFEQLQKGLTEMRRVLKDDGQIIILEFSKPRIFPFQQLYNFYFKNILPFIGRLTSKDPKAYQYLYDSVQAFPDGKDFVKILDNTGFSSTQYIPLTLGICSIYAGRK